MTSPATASGGSRPGASEVANDRPAHPADRPRGILYGTHYGTDGPVSKALSPREGWDAFRTKLPLTEEELRTIADNVAPYLR